MSNLQFVIFEDNKENKQSNSGLVSKPLECKLKTLTTNENIEAYPKKPLTADELKSRKANLLQPIRNNEEKSKSEDKTSSETESITDENASPKSNSKDDDKAETTSYRNNSDIFDKTIVETPLSESAESPMSVDHSFFNKSALKIPHNDRRFSNLFEVQEYQRDILKYLKNVESDKNFRPKHDYMKKQPDVNDSMRTILVDWLVEVSEEYRLNGETLYLAVNYIDRFLSFMSVVRAKLQLVGATAILLASKFEEIYPPEINEFVYICDDTYTKQQILRMEKLILKVLSFDLGSASPLNFLNLFSCMIDIPENVQFMAKYLCELSLLKASPFLSFKPSQIASAALALSFYNFGMVIWNAKMKNAFGYELESLKEIILQLNQIHSSAHDLQQQAIQEKYKSSKYLQVSNINPKKLEQSQLDELIVTVSKTEIFDTDENIENVRKAFQLVN